MTDPKKVTFYSTEPNTEISMVDQVTGETELMNFTGGTFATADPRYLAKLEMLAATAGSGVSRKAPSSEKK